MANFTSGSDSCIRIAYVNGEKKVIKVSKRSQMYKASRVASARLKPFAYDCFRQVRVQTKKPEVRIAGAKPLWS